jgi:hypothetical protein
MKRIVLDKGFLMAVSASDFRELSKEYQFLASASLLGECFKHFSSGFQSDDNRRRQIQNGMRKFSGRNHCLFRVDDLTAQHGEVSIRRPWFPLGEDDFREIYFNPEIIGKALSGHEEEAVHQWFSWVREEFESVCDCTKIKSPIWSWDEELERVSLDCANDRKKLRACLKTKIPIYREKISSDVGFVRKQYAWMRPFGYPSPELINERWILFRNIQTQLLIHLDLALLAAQGSENINDAKLINLCVDYRYCAVASQFGALATSDDGQKERLKLLCPEGEVLFFDHRSSSIQKF